MMIGSANGHVPLTEIRIVLEERTLMTPDSLSAREHRRFVKNKWKILKSPGLRADAL